MERDARDRFDHTGVTSSTEPDETGEPFAREYHRAIQESPDVAMAHGEWKRLITA